MRKILLTKNKYTTVDDDDYDYLNQWKWYYNGGYAVRGCPKRILMHRVIMKTPDNKVTDHINRNKLDNQKNNLRIVDVSINNFNTKIRVNNRSGVKGIYWSKAHNKWRPAISKNGKRYNFGLYKNLIDAINARNNIALKLYGEL